MSLELAIILFGISLAINIFLGFFAIFYPTRITSRDYAEISKMTKATLEISKIIRSDLKSVEGKVIDKVMAIPSIGPTEKKTVGTTISSTFKEFIPSIIPLGKDQLEIGERIPETKLLTSDEIEKKYTKKKKDK